MNPEQIIAGVEHTLIIVRRVLTDPKTCFAGAIIEVFSARFKASMAAFKDEMTTSRSLGRWDPVSMVEARGGCERGKQREG